MFPTWFYQKGYLQGVFWITLVALTSNMNDIFMRLLGSDLPPLEVTFFRYLFASLTLLPVMISRGKDSFVTKRPLLHVIRSLLLFGAMACWVMGLSVVKLIVASTLALTTNLFVLPMAFVFLKEKVGWQRTLATLLGFVGVFIIVYDAGTGETLLESMKASGNGSLYLVAAAMMFALSDIINKRFVASESTLSMMFYIAVGTALIGFYPTLTVWQPPTGMQYFLLFLLGCGANLILYFLLKAFAATDVSALSPYRYLELITASIFGFLLFQETPTSWVLVGIAIIVPSTFWIARYENQRHKRDKAAVDPHEASAMTMP